MPESESLRTYWWKDTKTNVSKTLFGIIRYLDQNQAYVQQNNLRHLRLYGNMNVIGLSTHTYAQNQNINSPYDRVTLNVVQSCCDTVTQKIAKNKPKPMFLTEGGDWEMQEKAKLLDKYMVGQFYAMDLYAKGVRSFLDASVFGTGALKFFVQDGKICSERVLS